MMVVVRALLWLVHENTEYIRTNPMTQDAVKDRRNIISLHWSYSITFCTSPEATKMAKENGSMKSEL